MCNCAIPETDVKLNYTEAQCRADAVREAADEIERLRAALSEVLEVVSLPREPSWAYRNTITTNKDRIKAACRAGLGLD